MGGASSEKIEHCASISASAAFAGAVGFAALHLLQSMTAEPVAGISAIASAGIAYLLCERLLARITPGALQFGVPRFAITPFEPIGLEELLLTDADRFQTAESAAPPGEPLELEDILQAIGPEARVVRLFGGEAMPSPGQLAARIGSHLEGAPPPAASLDASQALYEALAELRRSLR